ncbi:hypothetical protein ACFSQD_19205 [Flavihumibacter stibioxidans]|uniref:Uncharacterized protein n=1 Tax=Flavihumibacter stibioxidans TaxID=1834163 RepID=A0ABR7MCU5_9BACT|nr:hypothetical protein [Flavihumibacter stibioxidans]MBC6492456.1 hypothetical protein [Flavihumibacter stibioxidans]
MFHLLLVTTYEVGKYVQVVAIISLPVIIITLLLIVWLHYRKKKQPDPTELLLSEAYSNQLKKQAMENEFKQTETDVRYLQDMLQEKQMQIEFLQNQLGQRIRNYHEVEARESEILTQLNNAGKQADELRAQLSAREEVVRVLEEKLHRQFSVLSAIHQQMSEGLEQLDQSSRALHPLTAVGA